MWNLFWITNGLKDKLAVGTVYEYVQHCGDNGKSRKNRQTIINLLTYLDKSRIPEERYRSSGFLILSCMYNEYKNPGVSER